MEFTCTHRSAADYGRAVTDIRTLAAAIRPLSTDTGPMSVASRLGSAHASLLSADTSPCATDRWPMSMARSLESMAARPLSAAQGAGSVDGPYQNDGKTASELREGG